MRIPDVSYEHHRVAAAQPDREEPLHMSRGGTSPISRGLRISKRVASAYENATRLADLKKDPF